MLQQVTFDEIRAQFHVPDTETVRLAFDAWATQFRFDFSNPYYRFCTALYLSAYLENPDPDEVALGFLLSSPLSGRLKDKKFLIEFGGTEFAEKALRFMHVNFYEMTETEATALPPGTRQHILCHSMAFMEFIAATAELKGQAEPDDFEEIARLAGLGEKIMPTVEKLDAKFREFLGEARATLGAINQPKQALAPKPR